MNKKKFPITNIGSVSLLMIFIVLCMVTLAALSLSTAAADYRSSARLSEHTTEYYEASNAAEEKLADIDRLLSEAYQASPDSDTYFTLIASELSASEDVALSEASGELLIAYETKMNDSQAISVILKPLYPRDSAAGDAVFYQLLSWQAIHTDEWEGDNSMKLIEP